jgi:integrase
MRRLLEYFGETPLPLTQSQVDMAALELLPEAKPVTRNRKIYSPVSAVQRSAGFEIKLKRPAGSKSREKTDYMTQADAQAVIAAADAHDAEFGLLLRFLLYTGVRIGEALALRWEDTAIEESFAWVRFSKNGDPRALRLRDDLRDALIAHRAGATFGKVFRFRWGGGFKDRLTWAKLAACGVAKPKRRKAETKEQRRIPPHRLNWVTYHTFRHTWATWMRRYGGIDVEGLVATKNWRDVRSARRYAHVVPRDEWARVAHLPSVDGGNDVETNKTGT